jgi:hypothetical protein
MTSAATDLVKPSSVRSRVQAAMPSAPSAPSSAPSSDVPDWWLAVGGTVVYTLGVYLAKTIVVWLCLNLGPWSEDRSRRFQILHALALVIAVEVLLWAA